MGVPAEREYVAYAHTPFTVPTGTHMGYGLWVHLMMDPVIDDGG